MFKVGERRNPLKALPGIVRLSVLRAESMDYYQQEEALDKYRFSYCIVKFFGHDPVKTAICEKQTKPASEDNKGDVQHVIEWRHDDEELNVELDAPHSDYDQPIVIEMYDATEHSKVRYETAVQFSTGADAVPITSLVDEEDVKVGTVLIPLPWIVNGFGGGYCVAQDEPGLFRFYVQGAQRHSFPYELECKIHYKMEAEHSVRAHLRWTSQRLQGTYELDRTRSSNMEEFYQATLVPWAIRKMEESGDEEKLDVKVSKAGKEITITRATNYYKEEPEPMRVDELFQSVKTFRGTMAETRLYWDFSNVNALKKGEAYPSPILMSVTRLGGDIGEVVEAWDMHKEGKTLTQLSMLQKLPTKFKRVYTRISDDERIELPKHPKVVTKAGLLTVVVLEGRDLAPEDSPNLNAYAALKILRFSNKDVHCTDPINKDSVTEQATRAFDSDANPQWNQMFRFPVTPIPNFHDVLILQVWNKENAEDEALIGTLRIPVPWAYNGYGMDLGPWTASSFQASFKLKRGDDVDPSAKAKYGGGRVTLRFAYQPTVA